MDTLIFVLVGIVILVVILTGVAFYRGLFRLASPSTERGMPFLLMRKKDTTHAEAKIAPDSAKSSGLTPAKLSSGDDKNR